jgi:hypothetical protein
VFEQGNKLSPIDTKQQLQRINGHNYVQLVSIADTKPAFFLLDSDLDLLPNLVYSYRWYRCAQELHLY